jgi:hypothetical protein
LQIKRTERERGIEQESTEQRAESRQQTIESREGRAKE